MQKKFKVEIARKIYDQVMNGAVSPVALKNAYLLLGINPQDFASKNQFLMYFMLKESHDTYDRNVTPTAQEQKQIDFLNRNMGTDQSEYISKLDVKVVDKTVDKTETLSTKGSAADTSAFQTHSELEVIVTADGVKQKTVEQKIIDIERLLETTEDSEEKKKLRMKIANLKRK